MVLVTVTSQPVVPDETTLSAPGASEESGWYSVTGFRNRERSDRSAWTSMPPLSPKNLTVISVSVYSVLMSSAASVSLRKMRSGFGNETVASRPSG